MAVRMLPQTRAPKPTEDPTLKVAQDIAKATGNFNGFFVELQKLKTTLEERINSFDTLKEGLVSTNEEQWKECVAGIESALAAIQDYIINVKTPDDGKDAEEVDYDLVVKTVLDKLPPPEKGEPGTPGETPKIKDIVAAVLPKIKIPQPEKPKEIDLGQLTEEVVKDTIIELKDTPKLEIKDIKNLDVMLRQISSKVMLGGHGGGSGGINNVRVTSADTTANFLNPKITVGTGLSKSVVNPGGNETLNLVNSAPDQTVTFTGGTNVTVGGTYPNFTITDNSISQTAGDARYWRLGATNLPTSDAAFSIGDATTHRIKDLFLKNPGAAAISLYDTSIGATTITVDDGELTFAIPAGFDGTTTTFDTGTTTVNGNIVQFVANAGAQAITMGLDPVSNQQTISSNGTLAFISTGGLLFQTSSVGNVTTTFNQNGANLDLKYFSNGLTTQFLFAIKASQFANVGSVAFGATAQSNTGFVKVSQPALTTVGNTNYASLLVNPGTITVAANGGTTAQVNILRLSANTISVPSGQTVTDPASLYISAAPTLTGAGTFTNTAKALFVDSGISRFDGNVGFGATDNPLAQTHFAANTTALAAAIFATGGSLLTTPVAGAFEAVTDNIYWTIATGTARKGIVLDDGTLLTAGRVPFATTNGRLTDDADFTFATDTLTITKIAATTFTGNVTMADAINFVFNASTGTKIGTATSQKLAFWNTAPIAQPTTGIAAATFVANTSGIANDTATWGGYTVGQVVQALRNIGILA